MEKQIEYSQVLSSVKELRDRASTMQTIFNNVTSTMQKMTDAEVFKGIASTKIQEEFAQNFNKGLNEGRTQGVAQGFDLGKKEEQLATAYKLIVNGKEDALDVLSLEYQYTKQEVYSILKSVKLNYLERLFNYLKEHGLLV